MSLDSTVRRRLDAMVGADRVVLFMKGQRGAPQCGFSAQVTQILDQLIADYATYDVLVDPELRQGIKTYSSWPTIPQLYVAGEFIGGCDIITEMFQSGELEEALGVPAAATQAPHVEISDTAARALAELSTGAPGRELHLTVDARYQNGLYFGPVEDGELCASANGVRLYMSPHTASRAEGLVIDAQAGPEGPEFRIDNPAAPRVHEMSAEELKALIDRGADLRLYDVRTPEEIATARIDGAIPFDDQARAALEAADRDAAIVFHCHHGGRSQAAAEHYAALGFTRIYNLTGGIDAWSREVDPSVPRY